MRSLAACLVCVVGLFSGFGLARDRRPPVREMAVTVDDLPAVTYGDSNAWAHRQITEGLLTTFRNQGIPAIGFVNEDKLEPGGRLDERRVAPVTVDNSDYLFALAFARAVQRGDRESTRAIADEYVAYMTRVVAYYEQQSTALFGREIPQVLLIHASALNAGPVRRSQRDYLDSSMGDHGGQAANVVRGRAGRAGVDPAGGGAPGGSARMTVPSRSVLDAPTPRADTRAGTKEVPNRSAMRSAGASCAGQPMRI